MRTRRQAIKTTATILGVGLCTALLTQDTTAHSSNFGKEILEYGMRNTYVKNVQKTLNYTTNTQLVTDGYFGTETKTAVLEFQKLKGIEQTGKVDENTKNALLNKPVHNAKKEQNEENQKDKQFYIPDNGHTETFIEGSGQVLAIATQDSSIVNGTRVRYIWETMLTHNYVQETPKTSRMTYNKTLQKTVKKFQKDNQLHNDGKVGEKTWAIMNAIRKTDYPFTMDNYIASIGDKAVNGNASDRISAMVEYFETFEDQVPYTWGGMGYKEEMWAGFDCSGLIYQMLATGGIVVDCTNPVVHAQKSFRSSQAIYNDPHLRTFPLEEIKNGDIVTFTHQDTRLPEKIAHDGIYYEGALLECYARGAKKTIWNAKDDIHRDGYGLYAMPFVKRPFV